ncbi:outer membrane lipid asymmetry maintenance protein MlaD [Tranquillimonas alkanivorans]|uniref:Phospholipid/cholesterol/gamma-HCH transport system substrate-binding protein n=1 Tax=Tranquillimonas alkanivorans TaxID=441119 RepID=A0A1I5SP01_9RHOB|nr:outer membrane lipid asymmetry maintenance protein MlaD [Tranquillimonas alkanivorans]SFP72455.1 phospholipid/cholesterol/gamma-HCH transport system substrate-binding protein [Tranquillimonas alkanivorans]
MASYNISEVATGTAVLAVAAGFLLYAGQVTGLGGGAGDSYDLSASFTSIEGISEGTDVRLAGVKVGAVTDLALNPQTFRADAIFTVDEDLALPEDTAIIVASEGLLGGSYLELLPGGSPFNLEPGAEIEDTQSAVSLLNLLLRYVGGGDEE